MFGQSLRNHGPKCFIGRYWYDRLSEEEYPERAHILIDQQDEINVDVLRLTALDRNLSQFLCNTGVKNCVVYLVCGIKT